jgi:hypothetical protein
MTILEFNEEDQMFHYNRVVDNVPQNKPNTNGYRELVVCINDEEASFFADFLHVQHLKRCHTTFAELEYTIENLINFIIVTNNQINK